MGGVQSIALPPPWDIPSVLRASTSQAVYPIPVRGSTIREDLEALQTCRLIKMEGSSLPLPHTDQSTDRHKGNQQQNQQQLQLSGGIGDHDGSDIRFGACVEHGVSSQHTSVEKMTRGGDSETLGIARTNTSGASSAPTSTVAAITAAKSTGTNRPVMCFVHLAVHQVDHPTRCTVNYYYFALRFERRYCSCRVRVCCVIAVITGAVVFTSYQYLTRSRPKVMVATLGAVCTQTQSSVYAGVARASRVRLRSP